jgi:hypothetical protein
MKPIFKRMQRAIRLDQHLFEEIVADPTTQGQSVWVMALFAMATAFGSFGLAGGTAVNIALLTTMLAWYVWAFSVFYCGTHILGTSDKLVDRKAIMRVMAFACAPGIIRLLGLIPKSTTVILILSSVWILVAAVMGVKKVFTRASTAKVAVLCVGTWVVATLFQAILMVTLLSVFGISKSGS